jgi:8-oxo-dGTP diphosphatase
MGFELRIVRNNPLTGENDLDQVLMVFLKQVGYLPQNAGEDAGFRLVRDCFLKYPDKPWTIDELLTVLETNKSTLYRYLNKLKGLDILDEIEIPAAEPVQTDTYRKIKKGYRFRFSSLSTAWGIVESHTSVALENYRKTVDHVEQLSLSRSSINAENESARNPSLTVDGVIINSTSAGKEIALIKRGKEPYKDMWALPGGFVEVGERVEDAVLREILEETGLKCRINSLVSVASRPDRDPRGHTVSIIYVLDPMEPHQLRFGDDASDVRWFSFDSLPQLAFDHEEILSDLANRKII